MLNDTMCLMLNDTRHKPKRSAPRPRLLCVMVARVVCSRVVLLTRLPLFWKEGLWGMGSSASLGLSASAALQGLA